MRKTVKVQLMDDDRALEFEITQMAATQKQDWMLRAALLLAQGAGKMDINFQTDFNVAWLVKELKDKGLKIFDGLPYEKIKGLLDDLLGCCAYVSGAARIPCSAATIDDYVSDAMTLFRLQSEALKVNFPSFFNSAPKKGQDAESPSPEKSSEAATLKMPRNWQNTPTSAG